MNRRILPVAIALIIASVMVGVFGQSTSAGAAGTPHAKQVLAQHTGKHGSQNGPGYVYSPWRVWCKKHITCLEKYQFVARGNPRVRARAWRRWCLKHPLCASAHPNILPRYVLAGPVGAIIAYRPEAAYVATFMQAARAYGVDPRILMGIGMVESGGGVAGTAYMGCMNYATFGSWPGQIYCAAQVLANVGLGGYNAINPSYPSIVMSEADGIAILVE